MATETVVAPILNSHSSDDEILGLTMHVPLIGLQGFGDGDSVVLKLRKGHAAARLRESGGAALATKHWTAAAWLLVQVARGGD